MYINFICLEFYKLLVFAQMLPTIVFTLFDTSNLNKGVQIRNKNADILAHIFNVFTLLEFVCNVGSETFFQEGVKNCNIFAEQLLIH